MAALEEQIYGLNQSQFDQPFYLDMLQHLPRAWETTGWNIGRVSRGILAGPPKSIFQGSFIPRSVGGAGFARGERKLARAGIGSSVRETMHLRKLNPAYIDPSFRAGEKLYTPFNFLTSTGNMLFRKSSNTYPILGEKVNAYIGKGSGLLEGKTGLAKGEVPFSAGTLGRMATMNKISNMSNKAYFKRADRITRSILAINPEAKIAGGLGYIGEGSAVARRIGMGTELGNTITGKLSGRFAGYTYGAQIQRQFGEEGARVLTTRGQGAFGKAAVEGAEAYAKGGARLASYAGTALRGLNVAADIMLVHDLALLAGKGLGAVLKGGAEAMTSLQGSINKPIMGMGFKDNSVAASSRARGVQAIQNSQLNARSILGSEANLAFQHFG